MKRASVDAVFGRVCDHAVVAINLWLAMLLIAATGCANASNGLTTESETGSLCSEAWFQILENKVPTGDGHGHGPDVGSDEWKSVVEFKLGIRDKQGVPRRDSEDWCRYIDQIVRVKSSSLATNETPVQETRTTNPSFSCDKVKPGSIEAMVCADEGLSALDRKLAGVYAAALKKAVNQHPPSLKAEQRGWVKGRNECWKAADRRECVKNEYESRIVELEAWYRLVPYLGPVRFICDGNPSNEVVATFFQTDPPTLIAEHGDSVSLMYLQPSGSGSRYQGRNETFWEHQGQALIIWGYGSPEMRCIRTP